MSLPNKPFDDGSFKSLLGHIALDPYYPSLLETYGKPDTIKMSMDLLKKLELEKSLQKKLKVEAVVPPVTPEELVVGLADAIKNLDGYISEIPKTYVRKSWETVQKYLKALWNPQIEINALVEAGKKVADHTLKMPVEVKSPQKIEGYLESYPTEKKVVSGKAIQEFGQAFTSLEDYYAGMSLQSGATKVMTEQLHELKYGGTVITAPESLVERLQDALTIYDALDAQAPIKSFLHSIKNGPQKDYLGGPYFTLKARIDFVPAGTGRFHAAVHDASLEVNHW